MSKKCFLFFRPIFFFFVVLFFCGFLQAQIPTGKFIGKVKDDEGLPLPGVSVEATSPKLVGSAETITDTDGAFRLLSLKGESG